MKRVRGGPVLWCLTSLATALVGGSVGAGTAGTETYTYDALGRLVKVEPPDGTLSSYGYDKAGNRLSVNTGTDITAPSVPTGLAKVSATSLQVVLSWTASTDTGGSGLSGYRIYRAVSPFTTFVQLSPGTSPTAGYTDGTTAGTIGYQYKVAAVDVVGNVSAQSIALAVTTPDTIAPSVPTGIAGAAASAAQINLSWNASTDTGGSGLKGYKVFRNGSPVVTTTTTASTYSDTGLTASTTYSYAVGAYDVAGNMSAQSGPVSATTLSSAGGMFSFVSGSHTSVGSSGDIATATIKNAGTATITAIIASCYSANGVYHNYGNGVTTLAAGATALYQCQAAASGTYSVSISMQGTGAANTGASWSW